MGASSRSPQTYSPRTSSGTRATSTARFTAWRAGIPTFSSRSATMVAWKCAPARWRSGLPGSASTTGASRSASAVQAMGLAPFRGRGISSATASGIRCGCRAQMELGALACWISPSTSRCRRNSSRALDRLEAPRWSETATRRSPRRASHRVRRILQNGCTADSSSADQVGSVDQTANSS
jgi:hypothetical protein